MKKIHMERRTGEMIKKFETYINEEWEYYNTLEKKFPIGSIVKIKPNYYINELRNKIGKVIGYYSDGTNILVKFDQMYSSMHQHNGDGKDPEKLSRYFGEDEVDLLNGDYLRKKEEMRLKYMDIDPYGEEDWEINESNREDFSVGDRVICKGSMDEIVFRGEIGTIVKINLNHYVHKPYAHVVFETKFNQHLWGDLRKGYTKPGYDIYFDFLTHVDPEKEEKIRKRKEEKEEKIRKRKEEIRLKYMDIDPYGEEDWEINECLKK